jgi:hypothetical protein
MDIRDGEVASAESLVGGRAKLDVDARNRSWVPSHDVQFYDGDESLAATVAAFLIDGIRLGQPCVVIATPEHRQAIQAQLRAAYADQARLVAGRDALWLDARDMLASFMDGDIPNEQRFQEAIGAALATLTAKRPKVMVRAFGEMVDLLWRDGRMDAAITLEKFWNRLAHRHEFSLLCAYSRETLTTADPLVAVERICKEHTRLLPFLGTPAPRA